MNELGKISGKILIVDDDEDVLYTARMVLKRRFTYVKTISDPLDIPKMLSKESFDVIILDMNFSFGVTSGKQGIRWLKKILQIDPGAHVIMSTAYGEIELAVETMKEGAIDFLVKPWENEKLLASVQAIFDLSRTKKEVIHLKHKHHLLSKEIDKQYHDIIAESDAMKQVMSYVRKVAATDATVLVLGENGTGKELIARAIHKHSLRSEEAFVKVDLGSISESLFESEMFGHKKGAFTDAKEDRVGHFEIARGGTLFLDEIGNLPLGLQAKLLTAIQSKHITRVGTTNPIPLDIRLICATNQELYKMVVEKQFRQDLLYRINTVEVILPPLRDRPKDIPSLAGYYLTLFSAKYNKQSLNFEHKTLEKLQKYHWPGNIRELQHSIERAVIISEGNKLQPTDFKLSKEISMSSRSAEHSSLKLEEIEKQTILQAIKKCEGNLSKAAKELGMGRSTLYRKLEKYGI